MPWTICSSVSWKVLLCDAALRKCFSEGYAFAKSDLEVKKWCKRCTRTLPSKNILAIAWLEGDLQGGSYMLSHSSFVNVSDPPFMVFHWDTVNGIIHSSCGIGSIIFLETNLQRWKWPKKLSRSSNLWFASRHSICCTGSGLSSGS